MCNPKQKDEQQSFWEEPNLCRRKDRVREGWKVERGKGKRGRETKQETDSHCLLLHALMY